jgi:cation:H+ antiporter
VVGFVLLIKSADWLVDGASSIARSLKVSELVIGLTIVAFGTSLPELFVNIFASYAGNPDLAIGNVVGSNIANILLILGTSAMIVPLTVHRTIVIREIPMSLLASIALILMVNDAAIDGLSFSTISRVDGMLLLCFFAVFMYYTVRSTAQDEGGDEQGEQLPMWKSLLYVALGVAGLYFGGEWIVKGATEIARFFGMSDRTIGLTVVAIGTSLPEFAASVAAARKGKADIAIGNVVGSNIFNILWILGVSSIILPLPLSAGVNTDMLMALFATVLLFMLIFVGKRHTIERWQGGVFVGCYAVYTAWLLTQ